MSFPIRHIGILGALVACGGAAETTSPVLMASERETATEGQAAAMPDDSRITDAPALPEPVKLTDPPSIGETVPLHLYVSNQSFEISPAPIDVWLQETHVITGGFDVEGQHNWILFDLDVPAGDLVLHAESLDPSVELTETIPVPAERWGVLDFWFYPDDPTHPMFTWSLHDAPVAFN